MAAPPAPRLTLRRCLGRGGRIMVANDRLFVNPVLRVALLWLFWVIPVAVSGVGGFDVYAASAARSDEDLVAFLRGSHLDVALAGVGAFALFAIAESWLLVAFCGSVRDGRLRFVGDWRSFVRVAILDLATYALIFGASALAYDLGFLVWLTLGYLTLYAPYAIALGDLGLRAGLRRGLQLSIRAPATTLLVLAAVQLFGAIGYVLIDQRIIDGVGGLQLLIVASILYRGLLTYALDCIGIGVVVEADDDAPRPLA